MRNVDEPRSAHRRWGASALATLGTAMLAVALAIGAPGCSCDRPRPTQDGGAPEEDAGLPDAGAPDAGAPDAGDPDAGPPPELKILKLLPPRGGAAGGSQVLITGQGFYRGFSERPTEAKRVTTLKFGGNPTIDFQIIDDNTIDARVPPGKAGPASVSITNGNGSYLCAGGCFTYYEELYLTGITPKEGPRGGGNEVLLDGQGFITDVEVLFAGLSAPKVDLVSSKQLKVVAPPGLVSDLVDVTVYNKNGIGSLRRVYRYVDDAKVSGVAPLTGPRAGGTTVVLTGQGLVGATGVSFGGVAATSFTVDSPGQITAVTPAAANAGAVDVEVVTPRDRFTARSAFTYVNASGGFALLGVFPHLGPASGGNTVTLTGQALDSGTLSVSIGGQPATVLSRSGATATLRVPARGGAGRKVDVVASNGSATGTLMGGYTYRISLAAVSPAVGPARGGTAITLSGAQLPADAEVRVGALVAQVSGTPTDTTLLATTPAGSGGAPSDLVVREAADPENEAVLPAAFTFEEALSIGRVTPDRGAIAGGSLVTVYGSGFGPNTVVVFGADRAKDVKLVDAHTLTCRTPKGSVGTVDVAVERLTERDDLPGGFSYFDPRSISGGLSGGPLVGTLNLTVLDASPGLFGAPVPLANVILGTDPNTPYQGLTDTRGQLTFSDPSLVKAQTVTVFKEGFETTTVTQVSSENLTVFVARTGGDGSPSPPPPGPPPSLISGRVTGFKPPRPLTSNEALEARVFVTQTSLSGGPPFRAPPNKNREKWIITADGADYLVFTGAGLRAAYAVLGVKNKALGTFEPFLMGVRRGITTSPDNPAVNQDIVLDMHLDMKVPITVDQPININAAPANNAIYAWLDLGAEGFIPNPNNWNTGLSPTSSISSTAATFTMPHFPQLDGTNFIFLNEAASTATYPVSYFYRRQPGDLSKGLTIGPMLPTPTVTAPTATGGFTGTISWTVDPGPVPDIHQVLVLKPTLMGTTTLWSVILPGTDSTVTLPAPAVQKLKDEETGTTLFVGVLSSRSPKFNYNQWTYDTLSGVSWSSYTLALSDSFSP